MTSDRGNAGGADSLDNSPVTPKGQSLNPNANVFQSKSPTTPTSDPGDWPQGDESPCEETTTPSSDGFLLMNGDAEPQEPPVVNFPPTPESPSPPSHDYASTNGSISGDPLYTNEPTSTIVADCDVTDETTPLEGSISNEQLRSMLITQLEYYFSRENLASDTYLISQMDGDQYVPISTIANFNQVKKLTNNLDLVVEVLRESSNVQVDEKGEKVRPLHKRCIVILREVPETTPVQAVQDLFSGRNCPPYISCEYAANNNWYVTFDSDEDAQRAYQYLREEIRSFLGRPIMARIKAKPLVRSTFVPKNGIKTQYEPASIQVTPQPRYTTYPQVQAVPYVTNQPQNYNPFFPPNTVVPAWPANPTTFFDPGLVFAANGYTPGGTFKLTNTTRQSYQPPRNRNPKPHKNDRGGGGMHDRQHMVSNGPNASSRTSPRSDALHGGPGGPRNSHHSSHHHSGLSHSSDSQSGHGNSMRVSRSTEQVPRDAPRSEPQSRRPPYRSRRRRDDDGNRNRNSVSHPAAKDLKPVESLNFDLKSTAFPPLPGSNNDGSTTLKKNVWNASTEQSSTNSGEHFENKMSDVVKGTVKPVMKDSKTQTPPVQVPQSPTRELKETSVKPTNPANSNNHNESTSTAPLLTPPQTPQKVSRSVGTSDLALALDLISTKADASTSTSKLDEPLTVQTQHDSMDSYIEDENQPAKLSYAQMVQRAKAPRSPDDTDCRSDESDRETDKVSNANSTQSKQALRENSLPSPGQSPTRADANHNVKEEREQRPRGGRRMKENRDMYKERRRDRERDRDLPAKSIAK